jgi:hypothetical protein
MYVNGLQETPEPEQPVQLGRHLIPRHGGTMKPLFVAGLITLVVGIVLLFVPIPRSENHGVKAGDVKIGVTTTHHEKASPIISAVLIIAGAGLMLGGRSR